MVLMWILFSVFGLFAAVRTFNVCESQRIFSEKDTETLAVLVSALVLMLNFFLRRHLLAQILLQMTLFLMPVFISRIIFFRREIHILKNFVSILDAVVIKMRVGASLRESLLSTSATQTSATRFLLQEFVTLLAFDRPISELVSHPKLQKNFSELKKIDQQPHRAIERLKSLRRRLQMEKKLRQKSRKALLQARAQAVILSAMYISLLIYSLWKYSWKSSSMVFSVSLVLFALGSLWLWNMGRRFQWKI